VEVRVIEQITIAIFGVAAVYLSQDRRENWRRWACIFGLAAQPAWFYMTWRAHQWGVFALCFLYAGSWLRGFVTHWVRGRA
jgi:hypothetical protein